MSMKRTRQRTYSPGRGGDQAIGSLSKSGGEKEKSWEECAANQPDDAFAPYSLKSKFEKGALLAHPKFGKGIVVAVEEQRMDVLFADGKKKLGQGLA